MRYYLFILLFILLINLTYAIDYYKYEYHAEVNVICDEYIGFARFNLPEEYSGVNIHKTYMDTEYYIDVTEERRYYIKQDQWYVNNIYGIEVKEVEKIFDNNYNTELIVEDEVEFKFQNLNSKKIDRITIDVKDSIINSIQLFDSQNNEIDFTLTREGFRYQLDLSTIANEIRFVLKSDKILKIREVTFYGISLTSEKGSVYFKVNNNCNNTFNFYFGKYGLDKTKIGSRSLPVDFETVVQVFENSIYSNDFDNDEIQNDIDNCIYVPNPDQKDINFNSIGDACEDWDSDGILNAYDNCLDVWNPDQLDSDGDGIGDACDDNDGRFLEKNNYIVYIIAFFIFMFFILISLKVFNRKD
jgi:hypothetical protein